MYILAFLADCILFTPYILTGRGIVGGWKLYQVHKNSVKTKKFYGELANERDSDNKALLAGMNNLRKCCNRDHCPKMTKAEVAASIHKPLSSTEDNAPILPAVTNTNVPEVLTNVSASGDSGHQAVY
jgi:hypothetical protein